MHETKSKILLTFALIFLTLGFLIFVEYQKAGKFSITFCDIGQGDGYLIRSASGKSLVIDSGPGKKMASCLDRELPFWDRHIDAMLMTHPQQDHMEGQLEVMRRFDVGKVLWTGATNK